VEPGTGQRIKLRMGICAGAEILGFLNNSHYDFYCQALRSAGDGLVSQAAPADPARTLPSFDSRACEAANVELYAVNGEECCNLFLTNKQRYHPHGNLQHQGSNLIRDLVNTISCVSQPTLLFAPSSQSQPTHGEHIPCRSRVMKSKPIKWFTVRRRHDLSSKRLHENFFHEQAIKPTMTRINK
jgi:hypothetical protein